MNIPAKFRATLLFLWLWVPNTGAHAASLAEQVLQTKPPAFLPVDQAFKLTTHIDDHTLHAEWAIAPGYYLYQHRLSMMIDGQKIPLTLPKGEAKHDDYFGDVEVYHQTLAIQHVLPTQAREIAITYQGCAEQGLCYPPKTVHITLPQTTTSASNTSALFHPDKSAVWILLSFFGLGLGLSLTPCVFPLIPILSGLILGHGPSITTRKAFLLSVAYVQGMALTYAIFGLVVANAGYALQGVLQTPLAIYSSAFIFLALALAMFGVFELKLPNAWMARLRAISNRQTAGHYFSVLIMGALATLLLSPCTTPPLTGAILYIAQTGDALLGTLALYALGLGMGVPLLAVGISGGVWLPKAGRWMKIVQACFGVILLAMAINLLERLWPAAVTLSLWAVLAMGIGVYMGALRWQVLTAGARLWQTAGLALLIYGVSLLVGALSGGMQKWPPLVHLTTSSFTVSAPHSGFRTISTFEEWSALSKDPKRQRIILLDFYADWCVACREYRDHIFPDPGVRALLDQFLLIQIDVTQNSPQQQALLAHFQVLGLPTLAFFDVHGQELTDARISGELDVSAFKQHLQQILEKSSMSRKAE